MSKKTKFKHFNTAQDVLAYIDSELTATLRDDLGRMQREDRNHYTDADRAKMRAMIADVEAVMPLVLRAHDVHTAAQSFLARWGNGNLTEVTQRLHHAVNS